MDLEKIVEAVKSCLPVQEAVWPLHEPLFIGDEWKYVKQSLDEGYVSSIGHFVDDFEEKLKNLTGAKHAIATVNGTAALHICLKLAGVKAGDEVLTPALSFIATSNAIHYCGATPHFVDVEWGSLGVDARLLREYLKKIAITQGDECLNKETGRPIRALCVTHILGRSADLDALKAVCKEFKLELVEDAAEALCTYYKGQHVGYGGVAGALSFNGNKLITTGGGGAILTDNEEHAKKAKHLTTTAKQAHPWMFNHDETAYNYRLPSLNAALGCAQLDSLPKLMEMKRHVTLRYQAALSELPGVTFYTEPSYGQSNYWLNAIFLENNEAEERDALLRLMHEEGIMGRALWELHHCTPMYAACPRMDLSVSECIAKQLVKLPSGARLGQVGGHHA